MPKTLLYYPNLALRRQHVLAIAVRLHSGGGVSSPGTMRVFNP